MLCLSFSFPIYHVILIPYIFPCFVFFYIVIYLHMIPTGLEQRCLFDCARPAFLCVASVSLLLLPFLLYTYTYILPYPSRYLNYTFNPAFRFTKEPSTQEVLYLVMSLTHQTKIKVRNIAVYIASKNLEHGSRYSIARRKGRQAPSEARMKSKSNNKKSNDNSRLNYIV